MIDCKERYRSDDDDDYEQQQHLQQKQQCCVALETAKGSPSPTPDIESATMTGVALWIGEWLIGDCGIKQEAETLLPFPTTTRRHRNC